MVQTDLIPGSTFASYRLDAVLGEGSFGVVWRAQDAGGRSVALKILRGEMLADPDVARRFDREVRISLSVLHPRVVRALDAGICEGRRFVASELMTGGSVADELVRSTRLAPERAAAILADLLEALGAVQRHGLVHRDVKPANLLLDAGRQAKLADLGLARSTADERERFTMQGALLGSPVYMAPEQIRGQEDLDIRCDLYAAGVVLFECLAGEPPFTGGNVLAVLHAHMKKPVPDLARLCPGLPKPLLALTKALLAKDRERRPRDPAAALALLNLARPDQALSGTMPDGAAVPRTMPDGAAVPRTMPDGATVPRTMPDGAAVPRTMPDAPASAPQVAPRQLTPLGEATTALRRLKLPIGGETWFVYAGRNLVCGRQGLENAGVDVCLRLMPQSQFAQESMRISGQHLRFTIDGATATVCDLGGSGGTRLDGSPLPPRAALPLASVTRIDVAGALALEARLLPPGPPAQVAGLGAVACSPALLLRRRGNRPDHVYLLVPDSAELPGGQRLWCIAGGLWAEDTAHPDTVIPLLPGATCGGLPVSELLPSDQKG